MKNEDKADKFQLLYQSPGLREMKLNPLTLSFSGEFKPLESIFRADYYLRFLRQVRFSIVLAISLYGIFGILDAKLIPEMRGTLWLIRYLIIIPSLFCAFLLSFSSYFKNYMQVILAAITVISGLGIIAMIIIAPPPVNFSYYTGLILVFMFGYTFIRLRFVWASLAAWTIVACYEIAAIGISPTPVSVLLNNNFFFISANIIGMFACYSIEYTARKDFYLARLLENEQIKVQAANRELEKRVQHRTSQLVKANEDLRLEIAAHNRLQDEKERLQAQLQQAQKMEAIGTLAGGIAHDFNNILAAIMGYSEMALLKIHEQNRVSYNLKQVVKASQRAKELVNQILTFSRQRQPNIQSVQIKPIVKEVLNLLKASLPKNIEIRQNIDCGMCTIAADATQIHQVLMNLCTNAAHAMEQKGGVLEVSLVNINIDFADAARIPGLRPGAYVKLVVKDTGFGIDPAIMDRIFDPYFTTKEQGKGTGMGLSVVHGIVKSHGGAISVGSTPGEGACFELFFPRFKGATLSEVDDIRPLLQGDEHILFVDDEEFLIDLGQQMLERLGYHVTVSLNPLEALELFRAQPEDFDLVITDMAMPMMTGEKLASEILRIRSDVPILMCTGFSEQMTVEKARAIGISELLMKPLVIRDLAKIIRKVIDDHSL